MTSWWRHHMIFYDFNFFFYPFYSWNANGTCYNQYSNLNRLDRLCKLRKGIDDFICQAWMMSFNSKTNWTGCYHLPSLKYTVLPDLSYIIHTMSQHSRFYCKIDNDVNERQLIRPNYTFFQNHLVEKFFLNKCINIDAFIKKRPLLAELYDCIWSSVLALKKKNVIFSKLSKVIGVAQCKT